MPVEIDTTTCRLSNFENGLVAEVARLQCREVELVSEIKRLQADAAEKDEAIARHERTIAAMQAAKPRAPEIVEVEPVAPADE